MMNALEIAKGYIGLKEVPGAGTNPTIAGMFADIGHPEIKSDEISWCAAFVGHCLIQAGLRSTGSLAARSYLKWGIPVELEDAAPGDVVVLWRVKPDGWQGHVFFYEAHNGTHIIGVGGNQSNAVTRTAHARSQLLGVRRAAPMYNPKPIPAPVKSGFFAWIMSLFGGSK